VSVSIFEGCILYISRVGNCCQRKALSQNNLRIPHSSSRHLCPKNSSKYLDIPRNFLNKSGANLSTDCTNYFATVPKVVMYQYNPTTKVVKRSSIATLNGIVACFWCFFMREVYRAGTLYVKRKGLNQDAVLLPLNSCWWFVSNIV